MSASRRRDAAAALAGSVRVSDEMFRRRSGYTVIIAEIEDCNQGDAVVLFVCDELDDIVEVFCDDFTIQVCHGVSIVRTRGRNEDRVPLLQTQFPTTRKYSSCRRAGASVCSPSKASARIPASLKSVCHPSIEKSVASTRMILCSYLLFQLRCREPVLPFPISRTLSLAATSSALPEDCE